MRVVVTIECDLPKGATLHMLLEYIRAAIFMKKGGLRQPDEDPMSNFEPGTMLIKVEKLR